ncbi:hypothetical protein M5U04_20835 [Xenorhabdus sp. XENO-1]|uniref:hypothetical protein n=1 Tax=Xenorhabdus bovienii TaxID=40576 RepID=UPI0020CA2A26|nr:hypothetical protein [Xenorhabdus bovienii]MCP9270445.1 hypothetical protein [Xenorhabdus bovienii subsp. africana]
MSNEKYVCPNCDEQVYFWVEQLIEHRRVINTKTGRMKTQVKKINFGNRTTNSGISCSKCYWFSSFDGEQLPKHFEDIGGVDQFIESVENS